MQATKRPSLPPIPAVLLAVFSVQGGAAIAKTLFPVLGAAGTAGIRVVLSAADPLNFTGLLLPGPRVPSHPHLRVEYVDGAVAGAEARTG